MDFFYFLPLWFLFGWIFLEVPGAAFIWMSFLNKSRFSFLLRFEGLEYDIGGIQLINLSKSTFPSIPHPFFSKDLRGLGFIWMDIFVSLPLRSLFWLWFFKSAW